MVKIEIRIDLEENLHKRISNPKLTQIKYSKKEKIKVNGGFVVFVFGDDDKYIFLTILY
jgi:hypothetical protein